MSTDRHLYPIFHLRLPPNLKRAIEAASERGGLSLSAYLVQTLAEAHRVEVIRPPREMKDSGFARIRRLASSSDGVSIDAVPGLTIRQVTEGARRIEGAIIVGYRNEARVFMNAEHAEHYRTTVLPAIKAAKREQRKETRHAERAAAAALRPPKPPKPVKVKAEKPVKVKPEKKPKPPKVAKLRVEKPPKQPKPKPDPAKVVAPHWRDDFSAVVSIPRYTGQKWDKAAPIDYSKAKVTVYEGHPGYDMRYSLPPGAVVEGEFSRIPLGATLEAA